MPVEHVADYTALLAPRATLSEPWARGHNAVVITYMTEGPFDVHAAEAGILALAEGLQSYVDWLQHSHADPLSGRHLHDMLDGFRGLLGYSLGRLDAGVLDAFATRLAERWGINPDTGEWVGGQ